MKGGRKQKIIFFSKAPFIGQISAKYFFKLYRQKIFYCCGTHFFVSQKTRKSSQIKTFPTPLVGVYQIFQNLDPLDFTQRWRTFFLFYFQRIFRCQKSSLFPAYYVGESAIQWTVKNQLSQKVQHFNWDKLLLLYTAL